MPTNWPTLKDAEFAAYTSAFSAQITAAPTTFGLVAGDATALATLVTANNTAYNAAVNPATRSAVTVAQKNVCKAALLADLRSLAKRIQANPAVTVAQKTSLGLPIHNAVPSPVPAPVTRPLVTITQIGSRSQTLLIVDETTPTKRARAPLTSGAEVYTFVGDAPPDDLRKWGFAGIATRSEFQISYDSADAGKQSNVAARWFNDKGEAGPLSIVVVAPIAA